MKYVSQALLEDTYRKFNKKYFNNKLPDDVDLKFESMPGLLGYQLDNKIALSKHKAYRRDCIWKGTLLHECIHLLLGEKETKLHGKEFQKEMKRLARLNAFKDIW
jgi:predicted SprT family Zn-dependent metalloprotease